MSTYFIKFLLDDCNVVIMIYRFIYVFKAYNGNKYDLLFERDE